MTEDRQRHWRRTLRLTVALLAVWFVASFGVAWFARDLSFDFFGWPFSFWVGAQGALLVYLGLVALYARRMRRLVQEHGVDEDED